jgi:hypothetical protein
MKKRSSEVPSRSDAGVVLETAVRRTPSAPGSPIRMRATASSNGIVGERAAGRAIARSSTSAAESGNSVMR